MKKTLGLFLLICTKAWAQELTPAEMAQMRNSIDDMQIKQMQQQAAPPQPGIPVAQPPPGQQNPQGQPPPPGQQNPQGQPPPPGQQNPQGQAPPPGQQNPQGQPPLPGQQNPQGQPPPPGQQNPQGQPPPPGDSGVPQENIMQPVNTIPNPPPLSPAEDKKQQELVARANVRNKSPFMIPTELFLKIKRAMGEKASSMGNIDISVEVRRRWPIKDYTLVGVIYSVKKPKAMIADREGKVHIFKEKDYIANAEGYISEINNGEVIVVERGAEIKLELKSNKK